MSLTWYGSSGRFPEVQFRRLVDRVERPVPADAAIVTAFTNGQVTLRSNRDKIGYHEASDLSSFRGVEPGDLVVHGLDILRGSVGVSDSWGAISSVCTVAIARSGADPRFIAYAIRAQAQSGFTRALARGIREGGADFRRWDTLAELPIPLPPVEEQRRIADFLDDQVARIQTAAELAQGQLERWRSWKDSAVYISVFSTDVIARDLRPSNGTDLVKPFVDSPPARWRVVPLRYLLRRLRAVNPGDQRLLSVYLDKGVIPFDEAGPDRVHNPPDDLSAYQEVKPGNLVMNNQQAWRGSVGVSSTTGIVSPAYHVFEFREAFDSRWANYAFRSQVMVFQYEQVSRGVGSIQRNLDISELLDARLAFPDMALQHDLAAKAHSLEQRANDAMSAVYSHLRLLEERKRAVITAAVTGELDVTTARPIGVGKWLPNVGASVDIASVSQTRAPSIGGIG